MSGEVGCVGSKKTDEANSNTEVSLEVETGHFSRTCSESAVLYEMAAHLVPVVQTLDSAIRRINNYPADKYYGN